MLDFSCHTSFVDIKESFDLEELLVNKHMKEFDISQFWPLLNTSSVQLSYFANFQEVLS